jgi:hypothetical protein
MTAGEAAPLLERARQELLLLEPAITRRLRAALLAASAALVRSHWSGELELIADERALWSRAGFRLSDGVIEVVPRLLTEVGRWRSWIHELLHAHSGGGTIEEYQAGRGWEEGPVEFLQRQWRDTLLAEVGAAVSADDLTLGDETWDAHFASCLVDLEALRGELAEKEIERFYASLLVLPLRERYASLLAQQVPPISLERRRRVAALARANSGLRQPRGM